MCIYWCIRDGLNQRKDGCFAAVVFLIQRSRRSSTS
jgi:hypothetical protein